MTQARKCFKVAVVSPAATDWVPATISHNNHANGSAASQAWAPDFGRAMMRPRSATTPRIR